MQGNFATGIRNTTLVIRDHINDWNLESKFHWQRLESGIHRVESRIQDCTWGNLYVPRVTNIHCLLTISIHNQGKGDDNIWNGHQRRNALIFCQIVSMDSERKCMETSVENLYLDIGPYRVKGFLLYVELVHQFTTLQQWPRWFTMNKKFSKNCGLWSKWNISIPVDPMEKFRKHRDFWKGSPVFSDGMFQTEISSACSSPSLLARGNYLLVLVNDLVVEDDIGEVNFKRYLARN